MNHRPYLVAWRIFNIAYHLLMDHIPVEVLEDEIYGKRFQRVRDDVSYLILALWTDHVKGRFPYSDQIEISDEVTAMGNASIALSQALDYLSDPVYEADRHELGKVIAIVHRVWDNVWTRWIDDFVSKVKESKDGPI